MLNELADYITTALKEQGIIVLRNDYPTGSIYLTFDCGQSSFLRISDHAPSKSRHVRYNLITTQKYPQRVVVPTKYKDYNIIKYYYTLDDIDLLIHDIINYVEVRKQTIGELKYHHFCKYALKHKMGKCSGFWDTCKKM